MYHLIRNKDGSFTMTTPMGLPLAHFYDERTLGLVLEGMARLGQEVRDHSGRCLVGDIGQLDDAADA
jgi:hypothetical protein